MSIEQIFKDLYLITPILAFIFCFLVCKSFYKHIKDVDEENRRLLEENKELKEKIDKYEKKANNKTLLV